MIIIIIFIVIIVIFIVIIVVTTAIINILMPLLPQATTAAQVGISIEPIAELVHMTPTPAATATTLSDLTTFTQVT